MIFMKKNQYKVVCNRCRKEFDYHSTSDMNNKFGLLPDYKINSVSHLVCLDCFYNIDYFIRLDHVKRMDLKSIFLSLEDDGWTSIPVSEFLGALVPKNDIHNQFRIKILMKGFE